MATGFQGYAAIPDYEDINIDDVMPQRLNNFRGYAITVTAICFVIGTVIGVATEMKSSYLPSFLGLTNLDESSFVLTSPAFEADGTFPEQYTCKLGTETGVSPPLAWTGAPEGTVDYLITMKKESGYSWAVYDISSDITHVDEAVSNAAASGATVGLIAGTEAWDIDVPPFISTANYVSMYKYEEPCSKGPGAKWYLFTIYAFSKRAADVMAENNFEKENTKPTQILEIMNDYILGSAAITANFNLYDDDQAAAAAKTATKAQAVANKVARNMRHM